MDTEISHLFACSGGLLRRRDHPRQAARLDRLLACGRITSPLPGILADGELQTPEQRIAAALLWTGPDAVLCGLAAARVSFWPDCLPERIEVALTGRAKRPRPGFTVSERRIPAELILQRGRLRFTTPALTAIDLAAGPTGGEAIDRVLRTRTGTLEQMWSALALTRGRRGHAIRADLLHDSRDEPWSEAERHLHRLFRRDGIRGWRANVWIGDERSGYVADVLFERQKLIIEVDGYATHHPREVFENDRRRRNVLVLAGYTVLNFTWRQIVDDPAWVLECVRSALLQL